MAWDTMTFIWRHHDASNPMHTLQWRHNGHDGVSNHQPHDCFLNRYSDADQRKHQSSAPLAFVRRIHRGSVNSPHKGPVTRKMFPFDDVIMWWIKLCTRMGHFVHRRSTDTSLLYHCFQVAGAEECCYINLSGEGVQCYLRLEVQVLSLHKHPSSAGPGVTWRGNEYNRSLRAITGEMRKDHISRGGNAQGHRVRSPESWVWITKCTWFFFLYYSAGT